MPLSHFVRKSVFCFWMIVILFAGSVHKAHAVYGQSLFWPTPNKAFIEGKTKDTYLQATASGRVDSGNWGCSRNSGNKFHEGVDLKSVKRDESQNSKDEVFAITTGKVVHVNRIVGDSNYGKYIVISHFANGLEWCSLYAHLESINSKVSVGTVVRAGDVIGIMGKTSSSIDIPESRAHLHFEIVQRISSKFDRWYNQVGYKTPNMHGNWNGMNLIGTDPFAFYNYFLNNPDAPFYAYFLKEPVSFDLLIHFKKRPDFLLRNPIFLRGQKFPQGASWYHVGFTWYGLPVNWTPVSDIHVDKRRNKNAIHIQNFKHERSCRNWIDDSNTGYIPTNLLKKHIQMLKTGDE